MSWGGLALSWRVVGASWRDLGVALGRLGAPFGANLDLRGPPDGPSWTQNDHLEAIWAAMLASFWNLGSDLCKNREKRKTNDSIAFWPYFRGLGCLVGASRWPC